MGLKSMITILPLFPKVMWKSVYAIGLEREGWCGRGCMPHNFYCHIIVLHPTWWRSNREPKRQRQKKFHVRSSDQRWRKLENWRRSRHTALSDFSTPRCNRRHQNQKRCRSKPRSAEKSTPRLEANRGLPYSFHSGVTREESPGKARTFTPHCAMFSTPRCHDLTS